MDTKKENQGKQTLTEQAEAAYKVLKAGEKLPEDTPEAVLLLARQTKMARDTQAAYTKTNQAYIKTKAERDELQALALQVKASFTPEQTEELEDLKFSDPDAWRDKLNEYEAQARQGRETVVHEKVQASATKAVEAQRILDLQEFTKQSGIELNDDIINNEVPPRITNQLRSGEISFQEFLTQAGQFLKADKTIMHSDEPKDKSKGFDDVAGSNDPDNKSTQSDFVKSYASGELDF